MGPNYVELSENLLDKIKKVKPLAYVDYRHDGKYYLLDEVFTLDDYRFSYKVFQHPDITDAGLVVMKIYEEDYDRVLNIISNLPTKIKVFFGEELYKTDSLVPILAMPAAR